MKYEIQYTFDFGCNDAVVSWRDRVGKWLRDAADAIDQRQTLALRMTSTPEVSDAQRREVIVAGLVHMRDCFRKTVAEQSSEVLLQHIRPELFQPGKPTP